jgi:hypothetical protein
VFRSPKTIIKYLDSLISNDEIVGAAIFSINGTIFYSSLPKKLLINSLREFENVAKQGFKELYDVWAKKFGKRESLKQVRERILDIFPKEKIILLKNDQKLFYKIIPHKTFTLIIVILFDSTISLGMADVNLQKISKNIKNLSRKRGKL